jgi:hypothetical protein
MNSDSVSGEYSNGSFANPTVTLYNSAGTVAKQAQVNMQFISGGPNASGTVVGTR